MIVCKLTNLFRKVAQILSQRQGSNLIETAIVVLIIALLAGIALPQFLSYTSNARISSTLSSARTVGAVAIIDYSANGTLPASSLALANRWYSQDPTTTWLAYQPGVSESTGSSSVSVSSDGNDQATFCIKATEADTLCRRYAFRGGLFVEQNMNPANILNPELLSTNFSPFLAECWAANEALSRTCLLESSSEPNLIFDSDFEISAWSNSTPWMTGVGTTSSLINPVNGAANGNQVQQISTNGLTAEVQGRNSQFNLVSGNSYQYRIALRNTGFFNAISNSDLEAGIAGYSGANGTIIGPVAANASPSGGANGMVVSANPAGAVLLGSWVNVNPVDLDSRYRQFSVWARAAGPGSIGSNFQLRLESSNNIPASAVVDNSYNSPVLTLAAGWQRFSFVAQVPPSARALRATVRSNAGAVTAGIQLDGFVLDNDPARYPSPVRVIVASVGAPLISVTSVNAPLSPTEPKMTLVRGTFVAPRTGLFLLGVSSASSGLGVNFDIDNAIVRRLN